MSLSTDTALNVLAESAMSLSESRQRERLRDVQSVLKEDLEWVERRLFDTVDGSVKPAREAALHLVSHGGKRVRPAATLLSAACFGTVPETARELAVVVELLHSSTLLHDDVIDEGTERRGAPTARLLWGNAISVLAGDVLLVHALKRILEVAPALMGALLQTLEALVSGEVVQLRGRTALDVSEETYECILRDKTASLFRFAASSAAKLNGASSTQQRALGEFGERLGIAFQLIDDVLDYTAMKSGKTLFADLREGKVTLPVVWAAESQPELHELVKRVHQGEEALIEAVQRSVIGSGACDRVRARAAQETQKAIEALSPIGESRARATLVEVARRLTARTD